jgi:hypothetical protein
MDANAPLNRTSFHAVLAGAPTLREAQEVFDRMTNPPYSIVPSPATFRFMIDAAAREPRGAETVLNISDIHQQMLSEWFREHPAEARGNAALLAASLAESGYGAYPASIERALMSVQCDLRFDNSLSAVAAPLLSLVQCRMNAYVEVMCPQTPTTLPPRTRVAVLAADILADIDRWFDRIATFFTAIVVPFSSIVAMRGGGSRKWDGQPVHPDEMTELQGLRQQRLRAFLQQYKSVIHLMSLREELDMSSDVRRYGIPLRVLHARAAAVALNLSRAVSAAEVYAATQCRVALVTTNFKDVGRFIVDTRESLGHTVTYINPETEPAWSPLGPLAAPHLAATADPHVYRAVGGHAAPAPASAQCDNGEVGEPATGGPTSQTEQVIPDYSAEALGEWLQQS